MKNLFDLLKKKKELKHIEIQLNITLKYRKYSKNNLLNMLTTSNLLSERNFGI